MTLRHLAITAILVVCLAGVACSEATHPTYKIARKGVLLSDENFDVVHVYGFIDNRAVARQITDFLNKSEPNTYHFYEVRD